MGWCKRDRLILWIDVEIVALALIMWTWWVCVDDSLWDSLAWRHVPPNQTTLHGYMYATYALSWKIAFFLYVSYAMNVVSLCIRRHDFWLGVCDLGSQIVLHLLHCIACQVVCHCNNPIVWYWKPSDHWSLFNTYNVLFETYLSNFWHFRFQ